MKLIRSVCIYLAILSILATFAPSTATAMPAQQQDPEHQIFLPHITDPLAENDVNNLASIATSEVSAAELAATETLWTREELMSAVSLDVLILDEDQVIAASESTDIPTDGAFQIMPPGFPDMDAQELASVLYADAWAELNKLYATSVDPNMNFTTNGQIDSASTDAWSSSPPFASYYINAYGNSWKQFPWKAMGRLFFRIPGRTGTASCTASVAYGKAVWTAGHCVFTPGAGWHTNMVFVPAYRNGAQPYGQFSVYSAATLSGWSQQGNNAYDIAMVAVVRRNNLTISQWVGHMGSMWNASTTQLFHAFGYPSNINVGRYLYTCVGQTYSRWSESGPDPLGIGCEMQLGASGGPWLIAYTPYRAGNNNYVNGVNSFISSSRPNQVFSPYFGEGAKNLYDWGKAK